MRNRERAKIFNLKLDFVVVVVVLSLRFCDRKVITWHNVIYIIKLRKGRKKRKKKRMTMKPEEGRKSTKKPSTMKKEYFKRKLL